MDSLEIAKGADWSLDKAALPNTRVAVLSKIRTWINGEEDIDPEIRAFLLYGQAGVGKSAIAHRIAQEYRLARRLGASFCFSKDRGAEHFFRTITRRLADLDKSYASEVAAYLQRESSLKSTSSLSLQVELLTKPFEKLSTLGTIVIVIDALDECYEDRDELMECLHTNIHLFPSNIRFIITSRPAEADTLQTYPWVQSLLLEQDQSTDADIYTFVAHQLQVGNVAGIRRGFNEQQLHSIVHSAQGIFQYAAVICRELVTAAKNRQEAPAEALERLVSKGSVGLDNLYTSILTRAYGQWPEHSTSPSISSLLHFRTVMAWILIGYGRISRQMLLDFGSVGLFRNDMSLYSQLKARDPAFGPVAAVLHPLSALLSGTDEAGGDVYPFHSSFRDFILDQTRSHLFHIGAHNLHHDNMASTCLQLMNQDLHFNMAGLESSYLLNSQVVDFEKQVRLGISRALAYACRFWDKHLSDSGMDEINFKDRLVLVDMFNSFFIFWLEALALERHTQDAERACKFLLNWFKVWLSPIALKCVVCLTPRFPKTDDARLHLKEWTKLVQYFRHQAEHITPHLYMSGLAFCIPENIQPPMFQQLIYIPTRGRIWNRSNHKILHGHSNIVWSAAFSPDGTQIVSASSDQTVRIWDAKLHVHHSKSDKLFGAKISSYVCPVLWN